MMDDSNEVKKNTLYSMKFVLDLNGTKNKYIRKSECHLYSKIEMIFDYINIEVA
jgi:hypothetical protein